MPFGFRRMEIPDVILIETPIFRDGRGFFRETYKASVFAAHGIVEQFVQCNTSQSTRGVLRGLHYQKHPQAQGKLVSVSEGSIFDVAVDIRPGSPTFGKWLGAELGADNALALYIPPGFAHGYCVLSEKATFNYQVTAEYAPELERGVRWNDPAIGVVWPVQAPLLSQRDLGLPLLAEADLNFEHR
ncbi:MAG: dTDP-4-dehydrorhamnose 3,5-epimerase [Anaerolineae bacterium]